MSQFGAVYGLVAWLDRISVSTVNGEHYPYPIFLPKMQKLDLHAVWFQQDGATDHTAHMTMDLLRGEFG